MKYAVLLIAILGIGPLAIMFSKQPRLRMLAWALMGFLPFVSTMVRIRFAIVGWDDWIGYAYALELSAMDILAMALYLSGLQRYPTRVSHWPFLIYIAVIVLSCFQAREPLAASFFVFQFLRVYFLVYVVASQGENDEVVINILRGASIGLVMEAAVVVFQRFVEQAPQPAGTFIHQNSLGLFCHFVTFPLFALFLAGHRGLLIKLAPPAGALIAVLTASRGAVAFTGFGFMATFMFSLAAKFTGRKVLVLVVAASSLAVLVPLATTAWERRIEAGQNVNDESVYDERSYLNKSASLILDDFPMGVGVNHYAYVAKNWGYALRAGIVADETNLGANVHNIYWLTAAETGYLGVAGLLVMLLSPLYTALRWGWAARTWSSGQLLLGLGVSLAAIYLHSMFEWILFSHEGQYMLGLSFGMIFAIAGNVQRALAADRAEQASAPVPDVGRGFRGIS